MDSDLCIFWTSVTDSITQLERFFQLIIKKFKTVSYVPGNHDLWIMKGEKAAKNSIEKFELICTLCQQNGVSIGPIEVSSTDINQIWILPLFSWYHEDFDPSEDRKGERIRREQWCDFRYCKWPEAFINPDSETPSTPTGTPELYFINMNEPNLEFVKQNSKPNSTIITFSHFLPRPECYPYHQANDSRIGKRTEQPYMMKVIGTGLLEKQIRHVGSSIHVFGHTHIPWNSVIDGVQYIQLCLKYPSERKEVPGEALSKLEETLIWDSSMTHLKIMELQQSSRTKPSSSES